MLYTASDILKQEITINPFESLFDSDDAEGSDGDDEQLDDVNRFYDVEIMIPFLSFLMRNQYISHTH
ncbi:hypothetical protein [Fodinibius sp.]|uniref:hypothetical protein n=1 Tax=Fodinibius sp. TaxID=1872440 RepID=UPI003565B455